MTAREFIDLVGTIQFRRGWTVTAHETQFKSEYFGMPGVVIEVAAVVEDAYAERPSTEKIKIRSAVVWSVDYLTDMDEHRAIARVWEFVRDADEHEALEWFRVRGVRVLDPHGKIPE